MVKLILPGIHACNVPKEMLHVNLLILYNINQRRARGETDAYKKNIHVPVGHKTRFAREETLSGRCHENFWVI